MSTSYRDICTFGALHKPIFHGSDIMFTMDSNAKAAQINKVTFFWGEDDVFMPDAIAEWDNRSVETTPSLLDVAFDLKKTWSIHIPRDKISENGSYRYFAEYSLGGEEIFSTRGDDSHTIQKVACPGAPEFTGNIFGIIIGSIVGPILLILVACWISYLVHHMKERKAKQLQQRAALEVVSIPVEIQQRLPRPNYNETVHDNTIVQSTAENLRTLKKRERDRALHEIRLAIATLTPPQQIDAERALARITGTDKLEQVALVVWRAIKTIEDQCVRENLMETLARSIASCVENRIVVCYTGIMTRLVATMEIGDDELITARPQWYIDRQLAEMAALVRASHLGEETEEAVALYESGNNEVLSSMMKEAFRQRVIDTMCGENGYTEDMIMPSINNMILAL